MVKRAFLMVFLVMCVFALAKTEDIRFGVLDSYEIKDKNITVMRYDEKDDKVVVCVNGVKGIISDEEDKSISGLSIHVETVKDEYAKLEITRFCEGSKCSCEDVGDECDNTPCFDECKEDRECDDGDELTNDACTGRPKKCSYTLVGRGNVDEPNVSDPVEGNGGVDEPNGGEEPTEGDSEIGSPLLFFGFMILVLIFLIIIIKIFKR